MIVLAGLVPAIQVVPRALNNDVDTRDKPAHDDGGWSGAADRLARGVEKFFPDSPAPSRD
jgi:hypothetical protein